MSLAAGARLGPYEIQAAVGAGDMSEVYKARDMRLDRTVGRWPLGSGCRGEATECPIRGRAFQVVRMRHGGRTVPKPPAAIETYKMTLSSTGPDSGRLQLGFENVVASVPFTVK